MTLLEANDIQISYQDKQVLRKTTLTLDKGLLTILLGINGIGKSSLLRTLVGLQKPSEGKVSILEQDIYQIKSIDMAKLVKWVSGRMAEVEHLDVHQYTAMGRYPYTNLLGRLSASDRKIIHQALQATHTTSLKDRLLSSLSDGEKQRVALAQALAQQTDFIVLDEPTAHLDIPTRHQTLSLLKDLCTQQSKTILLTTHELDLAYQYADQLWLMHEGQIQVGRPDDVAFCKCVDGVFGLS